MNKAVDECKDWPGVLGDICRGEYPPVPLEDSNRYRATGMGGQFPALPPLGSAQAEPSAAPQP
ncbi:MAG TPA: hypothetical protein VGM98_02955, partial [Schlesneria sp.]